MIHRGGRRVPGLPIRDCARGCDNCVHPRPQMSAIDVTKKYYLSVCIWFQEWAHLGPESTVPMHPQLWLFTLQLFFDFRAIFFPEWPLIFLVITIHQVIWPSPFTLSVFLTAHSELTPFSELAETRVQASNPYLIRVLGFEESTRMKAVVHSSTIHRFRFRENMFWKHFLDWMAYVRHVMHVDLAIFEHYSKKSWFGKN